MEVAELGRLHYAKVPRPLHPFERAGSRLPSELAAAPGSRYSRLTAPDQHISPLKIHSSVFSCCFAAACTTSKRQCCSLTLCTQGTLAEEHNCTHGEENKSPEHEYSVQMLERTVIAQSITFFIGVHGSSCARGATQLQHRACHRQTDPGTILDTLCR